MKKLEYSIEINAPGEKVWEALWKDENYRYWTAVFAEGSYARSDWKEGGRIQFLTPSGDGMYSTIDRIIPNKYMSFRHLGEIKEGKEQPVEPNSAAWSGTKENYTLLEKGNTILLKVEVDSTGADWEKMLENTFPDALQRVKAIAEKNGK